MTDFDTNWQGPEELKPRVYRTQSEKDTWNAVAVENEYRVPELVPDDVVIDIGANIGSFAHIAYRKGSRSIYAFELEGYNYEAALENLRGLDDGIALYHCAIVRGDEYRKSQYVFNGSWNTFGTVGMPVPSRSLDEILEPHESVRFLKIDVEGCEFPILYTSKLLDRVQEIAGEYHIVPTDSTEMQNLPYPVTLDALMQFLQLQGFRVQVDDRGNIGNFFAQRVSAQPVKTNKSEIAAILRKLAEMVETL